jgi:hypothetical protein
MPAKSRSQQRTEDVAFEASREAYFREKCDKIAKKHFVALIEQDGTVTASRDGDSWVVIESANPRSVWRETHDALLFTPACLFKPSDSR